MDYWGGNWKYTFSYSRMTCNQSNTIVGLFYVDLQDGATTVTGLLTILFQLTILLSFGQLAQLGQGGPLAEACKIKKLIFYSKHMVFDH